MQPATHKFCEKSDLTYEEVFAFAFGSWIPILKHLAARIGHEKLLEMLKEASSANGAQYMQDLAEKTGRREFADYVAWIKEYNRKWASTVTLETVEDSEKAFEIKVTECLWAKAFQDRDACALGHAAVCLADFASAAGFNPGIKLVRTKTLMEGHDCCNHRWENHTGSPS